MKLAVLFPGIGYTCDKPLLYYAGKLAQGLGYELKRVEYGNFPAGIKDDQEKMKAAFESALTQTEEILKDVDFAQYEDILFISKSVGTVVAACYRQKYHIACRSISFTPLEETFMFIEASSAGGSSAGAHDIVPTDTMPRECASAGGIMFHGTKDPWAQDSSVIRKGCERIGQPLYITENGNHSLETGNVAVDIANLQKIMEQVEAYIKSGIAEEAL